MFISNFKNTCTKFWKLLYKDRFNLFSSKHTLIKVFINTLVLPSPTCKVQMLYCVYNNSSLQLTTKARLNQADRPSQSTVGHRGLDVDRHDFHRSICRQNDFAYSKLWFVKHANAPIGGTEETSIVISLRTSPFNAPIAGRCRRNESWVAIRITPSFNRHEKVEVIWQNAITQWLFHGCRFTAH